MAFAVMSRYHEQMYFYVFCSCLLTILSDFDFAAASAKITKNYVGLTKLPINSILGALLAEKVITPEEKEIMEETKTREKARMEYLLDKVITRSLSINVGIKYKKFLEVMENSGNVDFTSMAAKLGMN